MFAMVDPLKLPDQSESHFDGDRCEKLLKDGDVMPAICNKKCFHSCALRNLNMI